MSDYVTLRENAMAVRHEKNNVHIATYWISLHQVSIFSVTLRAAVITGDVLFSDDDTIVSDLSPVKIFPSELNWLLYIF